MGFRPGHIRNAWVGLDTGSGGTPITWQHVFYPNTLRSNALLLDRAYASLLTGNLDQSTTPPKYYVAQGFFHPNYDTGKVVARVSFTCINTTSISQISFDGAFRSWDELDPIDATLTPGMVASTNVSVNAAELLYTLDVELQDYGNHVPNNFFQAKINWLSKQTATEVNIAAITIKYNLTKSFV